MHTQSPPPRAHTVSGRATILEQHIIRSRPGLRQPRSLQTFSELGYKLTPRLPSSHNPSTGVLQTFSPEKTCRFSAHRASLSRNSRPRFLLISSRFVASPPSLTLSPYLISLTRHTTQNPIWTRRARAFPIRTMLRGSAAVVTSAIP